MEEHGSDPEAVELASASPSSIDLGLPPARGLGPWSRTAALCQLGAGRGAPRPELHLLKKTDPQWRPPPPQSTHRRAFPGGGPACPGRLSQPSPRLAGRFLSASELSTALWPPWECGAGGEPSEACAPRRDPPAGLLTKPPTGRKPVPDRRGTSAPKATASKLGSSKVSYGTSGSVRSGKNMVLPRPGKSHHTSDAVPA